MQRSQNQKRTWERWCDSDDYPRFLTPSSKRFDPLKLAAQTERIVVRGEQRKYTHFCTTAVYGGIATGFAVGCCLRCFFCWSPLSLNFPERFGRFFSPESVYLHLRKASKNKIKKARISGCEPCIGRNHLIRLLEIIENSEFEIFILETNGILLGADKKYAEEIAKFDKVHVRVSLKAGTPEEFERKTGAKAAFFDLPFRAIENLLDCGVRFHVAAMSADPRIMSEKEREALLNRLAEIDRRLLLNLEEEVVFPYKNALKRLEIAGVRLEWPQRRLQCVV